MCERPHVCAHPRSEFFRESGLQVASWPEDRSTAGLISLQPLWPATAEGQVWSLLRLCLPHVPVSIAEGAPRPVPVHCWHVPWEQLGRVLLLQPRDAVVSWNPASCEPQCMNV